MQGEGIASKKNQRWKGHNTLEEQEDVSVDGEK